MAHAIDAAIYLSNKINELKKKHPEKPYSIDYIKIHPLLYIAQGIMLAKYDKTLFIESIFASPEGPKIDNLVVFYNMVGIEEIKSFFKTSTVFELTERRKNILDYVAIKYGYQDKDTLIFTMKKSKPYLETINYTYPYSIIPINNIKSFFENEELSNFDLFNEQKTKQKIKYKQKTKIFPK